MPDTNPTPVDLDMLQRLINAYYEAEQDTEWYCEGDHDQDMTRCLSEMPAQFLLLIAELRSARAAIPGPDSERIREVIATAIAAGKNPARKPQPLDYENADEILAALRAAGLLPGPELVAENERLRENWADLQKRASRASVELHAVLRDGRTELRDALHQDAKGQGVDLFLDFMRSYR